MARVAREANWAAAGRLDEVRTKVRSFCTDRAMTFSSRGDTAEAEEGSQLLTILLGGLFVGEDLLPKKARVTLREADGSVIVDARVEETYALALFGPFKRRYDEALASWLAGLRAATS